jgi:hypothetical protein
MTKVLSIRVDFPVPVDLPPGFDRALESLVNMVCEAYEKENPERTMWPAGMGAMPVYREPEEPLFDLSVLNIAVAERDASDRELRRRGVVRPPRLFKVVWTDGYNRETVSDHVVSDHLDKMDADIICDKLRAESKWEGNWFKVIPQDAHVWGGMSEFV